MSNPNSISRSTLNNNKLLLSNIYRVLFQFGLYNILAALMVQIVIELGLTLRPTAMHLDIGVTVEVTITIERYEYRYVHCC